MSLLHSVVFHMGGKAHTVRFVPLNMHVCALRKKKCKSTNSGAHSNARAHTPS